MLSAMLSISPVYRSLSQLFAWLLRNLKGISPSLNSALLHLVQTILRLRSAATSPPPQTRAPSTICASSTPAPAISSQLHESIPFSTSPLSIGSSDGVTVPLPSNPPNVIDETSSNIPLHNWDLAQPAGTRANPNHRMS